MNKFDFWIWGKILNIIFSTMTLNVGTVNMILLVLITVVKVFLTNLVTKPMLEMLCGEYSVWLFRSNRADPALAVSYPDYGSRLYCLERWGWGGGVLREGLASPLGRGSNAVKVLYATLLRACGVFIFNLLYYSKNAAPMRAGGLALQLY